MIKIKNETFLTPLEVANKFNVHISTVARWRQLGLIKSYKLNERKFLFSEKELIKYVKG
jgi:excisionase family DNA binding protein